MLQVIVNLLHWSLTMNSANHVNTDCCYTVEVPSKGGKISLHVRRDIPYKPGRLTRSNLATVKGL